jgi:GNAT superfamily N-acetyltransferase
VIRRTAADDSQALPFRLVRAGGEHRLLARAALLEVNGRSVDEAALESFLSDERRYLLLALEGDRPGHTEIDRPIGTLTGYALQRPHRPEPQFLLYDIDVREAWRRRGVGSALVERFIEEARNAGAFEVWVLTDGANAAAMRLYERSGMVRARPDQVLWVIPLEPEGT